MKVSAPPMLLLIHYSFFFILYSFSGGAGKDMIFRCFCIAAALIGAPFVYHPESILVKVDKSVIAHIAQLSCESAPVGAEIFGKRHSAERYLKIILPRPFGDR